jgi:serine/threonine protein kinase
MSSKKDEIIDGIKYTFRIDNKRLLGKGTFSTVYSGINLETNEKVAIKKIPIRKIESTKIDIINKEIDIINILMDKPHENIVKYYDIIRTFTHVYIVMEHCDGGNLSSILVKPMKEKYSKYYFQQIANALFHIHKLDIIHKDIKPDNMLLTGNYKTLKLCDFGFSITLYNDTNNKSNNNLENFKLLDVPQNFDKSRDIICGSPIYMSPEALNKHKSNKTMDVWGMGIILYEMIYGVHPCRGIKDIRSIQYVMDHMSVTQSDAIDVHDDGLEIIKGILKTNGDNRLNIGDLLSHSWMSHVPIVNTIVLSDIFISSKILISRSLPKSNIVLGNFGTFNKLKATKSFIRYNTAKKEDTAKKRDTAKKILFTGSFDDFIKNKNNFFDLSTNSIESGNKKIRYNDIGDDLIFRMD